LEEGRAMVDVRRAGLPEPSEDLKAVEALSAGLARYVGEKLPRRWGFAILCFDYDGPECSWVSSAKRSDMVKVLRELADKLELDAAGGPVAPSSQ
jgi:hypothetical protein